MGELAYRLLLSAAGGATLGVTLGFVFGSYKKRLRKEAAEKAGKNGADGKPAPPAKAGGLIMRFFSASVYYVLSVGLVWTVYFMVLGLWDKSQSEYAANAATLIVSVVTIFSIMIAFYEFMRGSWGKDG